MVLLQLAVIINTPILLRPGHRTLPAETCFRSYDVSLDLMFHETSGETHQTLRNSWSEVTLESVVYYTKDLENESFDDRTSTFNFHASRLATLPALLVSMNRNDHKDRM